MNRQFPAFRGIAILLVIINHSIVLSLLNTSQYDFPKPGVIETNILLFIKEIGVIAVPTFLFLAGSFMVYSLRNKPILKAYKMLVPALQNAIVPYIIWSLVFYLTVFFVRGEIYNIGGYLKNILVGYPYNFIPILVFYILLSPLILKIAEKYPVFTMLIFVGIQIVLANISVPGIIGFKFPEFMKLLAPPVLRIPLALWAVFYPFGIVFSLHSNKIQPWIKKYWWIFALFAFGLYLVASLQEVGYLEFKAAEWLLPVFVIPLYTIVERKKIPIVSFLEKMGKRSYGIYLLNIIFITTFVYLTATYIPWLYHILSLHILFISLLTLVISTWIMDTIEKRTGRNVYRSIFG
jgi:hypothetical protein